MVYDKTSDGCTGARLIMAIFPSTKRFFQSIYLTCVNHDFFYRNQRVMSKTQSDLWLFFGIVKVGYNKNLLSSFLLYFLVGLLLLIGLSIIGWIPWFMNKYKVQNEK